LDQTCPKKRNQQQKTESQDKEEVIRSRPMLSEEACEPQGPHEPQVADEVHQPTPPRLEPPQLMDTPATDRTQPLDNSDSTRQDPNYELSNSPCSRCELEVTLQAPHHEKPRQTATVR
jgi:hypothetical protein